MKATLSLIAILILLQGCLDFGEEKDFELNSDEGISLVSRILNIDVSLIKEINYHKNESGIDPYYQAKFKINPSDFNEHIILTDFTKDSITFLKDKPFLAAPLWFNSSSNILASYSYAVPGGQHKVSYDSIHQSAYYHYYAQ